MDLTVERGVGYLGAERTEAAADRRDRGRRDLHAGPEGQLLGREHARRPGDQLRQAHDRDRDRRHDHARGGAQPLRRRSSSTSSGRSSRSAWPPRSASRRRPASPQLPPNMLDMPIEELDLPMRAYNSLKRNNIVKVGQLLQLKDDDLLRMRNFGKKSLDEMKERLRMRGFIVPETEPTGSTTSDASRTRPVRRRGRGLTMAHRHRRPQAQPEAGPAARAVQEPDRVGPALRARPDHRGEGQGGPGPGRADDHARQARRPDGPPGGRRRSSRTSRSS